MNNINNNFKDMTDYEKNNLEKLKIKYQKLFFGLKIPNKGFNEFFDIFLTDLKQKYSGDELYEQMNKKLRERFKSEFASVKSKDKAIDDILDTLVQTKKAIHILNAFECYIKPAFEGEELKTLLVDLFNGKNKLANALKRAKQENLALLDVRDSITLRSLVDSFSLYLYPSTFYEPIAEEEEKIEEEKKEEKSPVPMEIKTHEKKVRSQERYSDSEKISSLSRTKELELVKRAQNGDNNAREDLKHIYSKLIPSIIRDYAILGIETTFLENAGKIGVNTAIDCYEVSDGIELSLFMAGCIRAVIREQICASKAYYCNEIASKVISAERSIKLGKDRRIPTIDELAIKSEQSKEITRLILEMKGMLDYVRSDLGEIDYPRIIKERRGNRSLRAKGDDTSSLIDRLLSTLGNVDEIAFNLFIDSRGLCDGIRRSFEELKTDNLDEKQINESTKLIEATISRNPAACKIYRLLLEIKDRKYKEVQEYLNKIIALYINKINDPVVVKYPEHVKKLLILASRRGDEEISLDKLAIYFQRPRIVIVNKLKEINKQLGNRAAFLENGSTLQDIVNRYSLEDSFAITASLGQDASTSKVAQELGKDPEGTRDHLRDLLENYKSSLTEKHPLSSAKVELDFLAKRKEQLKEQ